MMRVAALLALVAVLGGLFVFGLQPRDDRDLESQFLGRTMNDFEAPLFERYQEQYGETLRYSHYAGNGTPLVVNVWASWCVPACWNEAPRLQAVWEKHQGRIMMIGVNFQDEVPAAEEFLDTFGKTYPSVRDARGSVGIEWGVLGVPETYFIRGNGTLSYRHIGEIGTEVLEKQIDVLLEETTNREPRLERGQP